MLLRSACENAEGVYCKVKSFFLKSPTQATIKCRVKWIIKLEISAGIQTSLVTFAFCDMQLLSCFLNEATHAKPKSVPLFSQLVGNLLWFYESTKPLKAVFCIRNSKV